MSIRRFFTESSNNKITLLEGHTVRDSRGPYTISINDDSYETFEGELFPMDFDIEKDGEYIKEIRGFANAKKYVDDLIKDEYEDIDTWDFLQTVLNIIKADKISGNWDLDDYSYRDSNNEKFIWIGLYDKSGDFVISPSAVLSSSGTSTISCSFADLELGNFLYEFLLEDLDIEISTWPYGISDDEDGNFGDEYKYERAWKKKVEKEIKVDYISPEVVAKRFIAILDYAEKNKNKIIKEIRDNAKTNFGIDMKK